MNLSARLDAIRAQASGDGVSVTVDLHGKPVDLAFTRAAFDHTPTGLANTIRRLVDEAAADALRQGTAVLADVLPGEWPA